MIFAPSCGFTPCSSPQTYSGLTHSEHTFQVAAVDYGDRSNDPYTHDLTEIRPGHVMSAGSTNILMDTSDPDHPRVIHGWIPRGTEGVEIVEIERAELRDAEARSIKDLERGGIPQSERPGGGRGGRRVGLRAGRRARLSAAGGAIPRCGCCECTGRSTRPIT